MRCVLCTFCLCLWTETHKPDFSQVPIPKRENVYHILKRQRGLVVHQITKQRSWLLRLLFALLTLWDLSQALHALWSHENDLTDENVSEEPLGFCDTRDHKDLPRGRATRQSLNCLTRMQLKIFFRLNKNEFWAIRRSAASLVFVRKEAILILSIHWQNNPNVPLNNYDTLRSQVMIKIQIAI